MVSRVPRARCVPAGSPPLPAACPAGAVPRARLACRATRALAGKPVHAGSHSLQAACSCRQPGGASPSCRRGCRGCLVRAVACVRGCHEVAKGGSGVGEGGGQEPWRRGRRQTSSTPSWGTRLTATPDPSQKTKPTSRINSCRQTPSTPPWGTRPRFAPASLRAR